MKNVLNLFSAMLMAFIMALVLAAFTGMPTVAAFVAVLAIGFIPAPKGVAKGVVMEHWVPYIIERFWKDNAFLKNAYDESGNVLLGRIVHIPQIGARPNVTINRNSFPAVAVRRTDNDVTYTLDEFSTDPTHIPNIDKVNLSYNKQDSVLGDHMSVLDETAADSMILRWAENATTYHTTGGTAATTVGPTTGQTGNRYGFDHKDLKNLMTQFNINKVPKQDRFVMIDDNMYDYFYDSLGATNAKDFSQYANAADGTVGRLHGFTVMTRSSVASADSSDNIKALGSSLAPTDCLSSFAWQKNSIAYALGTKVLFQDLNNPLYYGDVYSVLLMLGGRVRRADGLGVYNIIQGTPQA